MDDRLFDFLYKQRQEEIVEEVRRKQLLKGYRVPKKPFGNRMLSAMLKNIMRW